MSKKSNKLNWGIFSSVCIFSLIVIKAEAGTYDYRKPANPVTALRQTLRIGSYGIDGANNTYSRDLKLREDAPQVDLPGKLFEPMSERDTDLLQTYLKQSIAIPVLQANPDLGVILNEPYHSEQMQQALGAMNHVLRSVKFFDKLRVLLNNDGYVNFPESEEERRIQGLQDNLKQAPKYAAIHALREFKSRINHFKLLKESEQKEAVPAVLMYGLYGDKLIEQIIDWIGEFNYLFGDVSKIQATAREKWGSLKTAYAQTDVATGYLTIIDESSHFQTTVGGQTIQNTLPDIGLSMTREGSTQIEHPISAKVIPLPRVFREFFSPTPAPYARTQAMSLLF